MKVLFIERNPKAGFSISKVFKPIIERIENSQKITTPYTRARLIDILRNITYIWQYRNTAHIYHITGDVHYVLLALVGKRSILTIHDTINYEQFLGLKRIIAKYLWYILPCSIASRVVCISTETKNKVIACTSIKEEKISVIYNPIDSLFRKHYYLFNKENPVILHIGTRDNKNLPRVIEALNGINCTLRIVGEISSSIESLLKVYCIKYQNVSNLTDEQIVDEYINCDIVSFPSTYEGFGMPIIEANAVGRPILSSNIEPMIEVSGNSALLVNPFDINDIKTGFQTLIQDGKLRESLIKRGFENVKRFDPNIIANQYRMLYTEIDHRL